jgi:hypothetical protein
VDGDLEQIATKYRRFAQQEAHGRSLLYERLATEIARDKSTLEFLLKLHPSKRQPNLLFAAVRYVCGTAHGWEEFRQWLNVHRAEIRKVMLKRRTQTNEPARCATLLPLLAMLPQPLALLEIGASAGLCLIPDCYGYTYNNSIYVEPSANWGITPPVFACDANAKTPIPLRNVEVAWRVGLDLEPIDLNDNDGIAWLEALVWPGEDHRLTLLRRALKIARRAAPRIVRGDLRLHLSALAAQAPPDATLVLFHSAVLAYIESARERRALASTIARLGAVWISNEAPAFSPCEGMQASNFCPAGQFLLVQDRIPVACVDPHGRFARWL